MFNATNELFWLNSKVAYLKSAQNKAEIGPFFQWWPVSALSRWITTIFKGVLLNYRSLKTPDWDDKKMLVTVDIVYIHHLKSDIWSVEVALEASQKQTTTQHPSPSFIFTGWESL